jgi:hypothetical protein
MNRLYKTVKYCAMIPMLMGATIFVLWLVTRIDELLLLGIFALFVGLGIVAVGLIALAGFYWTGIKRADIPRRQVLGSTLAGAAFLLSNFLVAGGIIAVALAILCRYTVEIHNTSPLALNNVRINGAGVDVTLGSIEPGAVAEHTFCIQQDGVLALEATIGATTYKKNISGYVNKHHGVRHGLVRVDLDGNVSVTN